MFNKFTIKKLCNIFNTMHSNEVLCNIFDEANKAEVNKAENTGIFFDGLEEEVVLLQGTSPNIQIRSTLDSASIGQQQQLHHKIQLLLFGGTFH